MVLFSLLTGIEQLNVVPLPLSDFTHVSPLKASVNTLILLYTLVFFKEFMLLSCEFCFKYH